MLCIIPLLPIYGASLGLSDVSVGLLFAAKPFAGLFASPLAGALSDSPRVGRRAPMLVGLAGSAAFQIIFALSSSFGGLLAARLLQGVASSVAVTCSFGMLSDMYEAGAPRSAAMGTATLAISLGVLGGPLYGGWLYAAGGVQLPFFIGAGLLLLDCLGRLFMVEPAPRTAPATALTLTPPTALGAAAEGEAALAPTAETATTRHLMASTPPPPPSLWAIICHPRIAAVTGALFVGNASIALMEVVLPLYLNSTMGLGAGAVGSLYAGGNLMYVLLSKPLTWAGTAVARWKIVALGCLTMGAMMPVIASTPSLFLIIPVWIVLSGVGMCAVDTSCNPLLADIVDEAFPGSYGKVIGVAQAGVALGFIVGPLVGTGVLDAGGSYLAAFSSLGGVALAYAFLVPLPFLLAGVKKRPAGIETAEIQRLSVEDASAGAAFSGSQPPPSEVVVCEPAASLAQPPSSEVVVYKPAASLTPASTSIIPAVTHPAPEAKAGGPFNE